MSANDDFSLHDDEELSLHDDASLAGSDDYDTWAMEMEHYLEYIDNEVWKVIQNGNSKKRVTKGKDGVYRILPPTTQAEQVADEKERKARTLLLMAVPKDHLRRFHGMDDAKEIWAAIKTRFGGNANSKKMQKAVLKQQFEAFTISSKESLEKGYDRFQKLLSQLDALGASVSDEDANHKFLRSLPPAWDNIQKTSSSSLASDNVAFLSQAKASSSKHKPSHNSGSYSSHHSSYTTSSSKATPTATPGLADEVIHSFLATNADDVDLIHEDLDQIDDLDLEEMDINWQIAMTAIKIKKFYKKTGRRPRVDGKMHVAFDKRKVECFNCHNTGHFARECKFKGTKDGSRQEASRGQDFKPVRTEKEALMTIDEGQINWVEQTTDEEINHALMAFTVNNEVSMCSKLCLDSYNALKAKYDELQSEFGDQEAALTAHKIGLKKVEAQLKASHKQQISLNEKLHFQANQIFEKDEKLKKYRRIGMKAVKDKDALQKIVDSWFASSKNLWKLIDCGMSSTVKLGLGYSIKSNAEVLSYEEEMDRGIFASIRETDPGYHDIPLYSRFKQVEYKGVPHPLSGDYTPREQEDIDDSLYEYGKYGPQPQTPSPTVSNASSIVFSTCQSNDRNANHGTLSKVPTPTQTVDPSCAQHVEEESQDKGIIKESCLDFDESLAMWKSSSLISYLFSNLVIKKPMFSSPDKECLILSPKFKFVVKDLGLFLAFASFMGFTVYKLDRKEVHFVWHNHRRGICQLLPGLKIMLIPKSTELSRQLWPASSPQEMVYVDDIIFGSTKSSMVKDFEDLMQKEFKMSSMGELTFFLGFKSSIFFMWFQVTPKVSHLHAVKRIFRDIGYEGNLAQLTFSKPLFSPQWKYLVHVLLHCLVLKSTSWDTIRTNIASALVGLAHNQKFNFSLMILTGLLGHISNGTPFLMYPRITPLTPSMLEVVHELCSGGELSTSPHSRGCKFCMGCSRHSPTQSVLILNVLLQTWYCLLPIGTAENYKGLLTSKKTTADPFFDEYCDQDAVVTPDLKE
ncbi:ribonuclease H-like domain-containing protein [Tanacetum coccineum]